MVTQGQVNINLSLTLLDVKLVFVKIVSNIYFSVMDKLPSTSYIRLVDVWLLRDVPLWYNVTIYKKKIDFTHPLSFSIQLYPFLSVILTTIKEVYNDDDIINHHGRERWNAE